MMLFAKWISCAVPFVHRPRFTKAQVAWSDLRNVPGFVFQVGGWDRVTGDAKVLACWDGRKSYERFMHERHDEIAFRTRQSETYDDIAVGVGPIAFQMPGNRDGPSDWVSRGRVLRVADCYVGPGRAPHFVGAQRTVWLPGMASSPGMLRGVFADFGTDRYLVASWWESVETHDSYASTRVGDLRDRAGADGDIVRFQGSVVTLERSWTVLAAGPEHGGHVAASGEA